VEQNAADDAMRIGLAITNGEQLSAIGQVQVKQIQRHAVSGGLATIILNRRFSVDGVVHPCCPSYSWMDNMMLWSTVSNAELQRSRNDAAVNIDSIDCPDDAIAYHISGFGGMVPTDG